MDSVNSCPRCGKALPHQLTYEPLPDDIAEAVAAGRAEPYAEMTPCGLQYGWRVREQRGGNRE